MESPSEASSTQRSCREHMSRYKCTKGLVRSLVGTMTHEKMFRIVLRLRCERVKVEKTTENCDSSRGQMRVGVASARCHGIVV